MKKKAEKAEEKQKAEEAGEEEEIDSDEELEQAIEKENKNTLHNLKKEKVEFLNYFILKKTLIINLKRKKNCN